MEGSPTGGHNQSFRACQITLVRSYTAQFDSAIPAVYSTTHAGFKRLGLLENLLKHVILEAVQLDLFQRKFNTLEVLAYGNITNCFGFKSIRADDHHLVIGQVNRLGRMLDNGCSIRGQDIFTVTKT